MINLIIIFNTDGSKTHNLTVKNVKPTLDMTGISQICENIINENFISPDGGSKLVSVASAKTQELKETVFI